MGKCAISGEAVDIIEKKCHLNGDIIEKKCHLNGCSDEKNNAQ